MTPHDQERFVEMIKRFVEGCGFERPFHLVVIDARQGQLHAVWARWRRSGLQRTGEGEPA